MTQPRQVVFAPGGFDVYRLGVWAGLFCLNIGIWFHHF